MTLSELIKSLQAIEELHSGEIKVYVNHEQLHSVDVVPAEYGCERYVNIEN